MLELYIFSSGFHCQDKAYQGRIYNIELYIPGKREKLNNHFKK